MNVQPLRSSTRLDRSWPMWRIVVPLFAITVAGIVVRWSQVGESLWLDELHTSWVAAGSPSQVLGRAHAGNQGPLYFYLVWGLVQLCGQHEWVLRLPSLLAGTALIPVTAWLVHHWSGSDWAACCAALLVALDRDFVFYAQEARPYAVVQLLALAHGAVFVQLLQRPTVGRRFLWILGAAGLVYLHYTTVLFLTAEISCWTVLVGLRSDRVAYRPRQLVVDVLVACLLVLPTVPHMIDVAERRANWIRMVGSWPSVGLWKVVIGWLVVPAVALLLGNRMRLQRTQSLPNGPVTAWLGCWAAVPLVVAWFATVTSVASLWMLRYLVASLVGAVAFASVCAFVYRAALYRVIVTGSLLAVTLGSNGMLAQWQQDGRWIGDRREDWRGAIQWLNAQWAARPMPVLTRSGLLEDATLGVGSSEALWRYCQFPFRGIYAAQGWRPESQKSNGSIRVTDSQLQRARECHGLWLVMRTGPAAANRRLQELVQDLTRRGTSAHVAVHRTFGYLVVAQIEIAHG